MQTDEFIVAESEQSLIYLARSIISGIYDPRPIGSYAKLPSHIGPTSADLISDTFEKAWVSLWRKGGTPPISGIDNDNTSKVITGRLWERYNPVPLHFGPTSFKILRFLVTKESKETLKIPRCDNLTLGDQVILYLTMCMLDEQQPLQKRLAKQPVMENAGLVWLGFSHLFDYLPPDNLFGDLVNNNPAVLDALTRDIAKRWTKIEISKRSCKSPEDLLNLGNAQDAVIKQLMDTCDQHKRRDLALFIVDAAVPVLTRNLPPFPPPFNSDYSLQIRNSARIAAGSLLRGVVRWNDWDQQHRNESYFDDNYRVAQLLLARFENISNHGMDKAMGWLTDLAAIVPITTNLLAESTSNETTATT
jgi:hypothetical protein